MLRADVILLLVWHFSDISMLELTNVLLQIEKFKKYAKYKAAYIHKCLKAGETPIPGPVNEEGEDLGERLNYKISNFDFPYVRSNRITPWGINKNKFSSINKLLY